MFLPGLRLPFVLSSIVFSILPVATIAQYQPVSAADTSRYSAREVSHMTPEWQGIEGHLPNPATASAAELETQGDILRARRYPEDALDYYRYALKKGANAEVVYKKMGITNLELRNVVLARLYFLKAVKMDRNDAEAWNNLGAVEYLGHQFGASIDDYKKAVKLSKASAIYHSNLGMAYFDKRDYKNSRKELATALKLDPSIFERTGTSGVAAQVLSPEDRARFCLEMAKTYASEGNIVEMLHSLSMASEGGLNLAVEMAKDKTLAGFKNDPRVLLLEQNAKAIKTGQAG